MYSNVDVYELCEVFKKFIYYVLREKKKYCYRGMVVIIRGGSKGMGLLKLQALHILKIPNLQWTPIDHMLWGSILFHAAV